MVDPRIIIEALEDARGAYEAWGVGTTKLDRALAAARSLQAASQAQPQEALTVPAGQIRQFLCELQERNEKDNGLFPQAASEVEADAKALRRILALLDFYHPPSRKAQQPAQQAVRVPLTDKAILEANYEFGIEPIICEADADIIRFARAIEAAHGVELPQAAKEGEKKQ
jgi:hypothetical protein